MNNKLSHALITKGTANYNAQFVSNSFLVEYVMINKSISTILILKKFTKWIGLKSRLLNAKNALAYSLNRKNAIHAVLDSLAIIVIFAHYSTIKQWKRVFFIVVTVEYVE